MPAAARRLQVDDRPLGVRVLTVRNADKRNALDDSLLDELAAALTPKATKDVRVFIVRGEGRVFSAGYDLDKLKMPKGRALPDDHLTSVLKTLESHPAPSIAFVEGPAYGAGCDLACACDLRVAADDAVFCMPPARLGVIYAADGLSRVARLVGLSRAKRMFFTGVKVPAEEAMQWGLVDELFPAERAEGGAFRLAESIAHRAPLAVQGMKKSFLRLSAAGALPKKVDNELRALRKAAYKSADAKEGRAAFLEKRAPAFTGK